MIAFDNFDLLIHAGGDPETFEVEVLGSPAGEASGSFRLPFSAAELATFAAPFRRTPEMMKRFPDPEKALRYLGGVLYDAIFSGDVSTCFELSRAKARESNRGLRIRLRFKNVPTLEGLPWEYMYRSSDRTRIALFDDTPIVRYFALGTPPEALQVHPPLRILVLIADPHKTLEAECEYAELEAFSREMGDRVTVERVEKPTYEGLREALARNRNHFHVFHFIGHGEAGQLQVEDDSGEPTPLSSDRLSHLLGSENSLRLAVLNACEGARGPAINLFSGVAQTLVRTAGVPAVVGMQFQVSDTAANLFSRVFYQSLSYGHPVDVAVTEARKAIFGKGTAFEWATPVLFMRSNDGLIFRIEGAPSESPPPAADRADAGEPGAAQPTGAPPGGAAQAEARPPQTDPGLERSPIRELLDRPWVQTIVGGLIVAALVGLFTILISSHPQRHRILFFGTEADQVYENLELGVKSGRDEFTKDPKSRLVSIEIANPSPSPEQVVEWMQNREILALIVSAKSQELAGGSELSRALSVTREDTIKPVVLVRSTSVSIDLPSPHGFRIIPSDAMQARQLSRYLRDRIAAAGGRSVLHVLMDEGNQEYSTYFHRKLKEEFLPPEPQPGIEAEVGHLYIDSTTNSREIGEFLGSGLLPDFVLFAGNAALVEQVLSGVEHACSRLAGANSRWSPIVLFTESSVNSRALEEINRFYRRMSRLARPAASPRAEEDAGEDGPAACSVRIVGMFPLKFNTGRPSYRPLGHDAVIVLERAMQKLWKRGGGISGPGLVNVLESVELRGNHGTYDFHFKRERDFQRGDRKTYDYFVYEARPEVETDDPAAANYVWVRQ